MGLDLSFAGKKEAPKEAKPVNTTGEDKETVWIDEVMVRKQSFDLEPVNQMFAKVHEYIDDMAKQAKDIKVIDVATMNEAIGMGTQAKQYANKIEKTRVEIKKPYLSFGKTLDNLTKAVTKRLGSIQDGLRDKVRPIMLDMKRKEQAAAAVAKEEADLKAPAPGQEVFGSQDVPAPTGPDAPAPPTSGAGVQTESGSAKLTKTSEWDVTDISKVPEMYLSVIPSKINAEIKAGLKKDMEITIPGIKIT